ncbi:daxx-like protein [Anastrepha ludens]|uniref:daxx-like protein n=1 Tax=Anastrepha ludens TaxID=28586 RepID=UPI0023B0C4FC|nr:daxx-like protein [Anastrepha ludens]
MSSVIVVDSSDEEEVPAKRAFIAPSIPATITPIKGTTTQCPANVSTNQLKHKKIKSRPIPSGITITRRSPINVTSSSSASNNANPPAAAGSNATTNMSDSLSAKISAATAAATSKLNSMLSKTTMPSLLKLNAASSISNVKERQTPTPPRQMPQQLNQKHQQQHQLQTTVKQNQQRPPQQGLPLLSQLPQLQPSPSVLRKRLSTTAALPTQQLQAQQQQLPKLQKSKQQQNPPKLQQPQQLQQRPQLFQLEPHARKLNTPPATITAIGSGSASTASTSNAALLPLISTVQSMAAGATPPLQLLATPPHSAATTFSDQQLFSPKLMHTTCSLPPSTTVTAARPQVSSSTNISNSNSNTSGIINNNNKNINNNFKIMLPPKSSNSSAVGVNLTTSSMASTPATTSMATPVALQQSNSGPRIAYVNSLATQISPTINKTNSNSAGNYANKPRASTAAVVPIAITAAPQLASIGVPPTSGTNVSTPLSTNALSSVRRVKPTTLLRKNDEAWLKRTCATTTANKFNDDDLVLELLPHSANSKAQPQTTAQVAADAVQNSTKPQTLPMQKTPAASVSIPNKPTFVSTQKTALNKSAFPLKIDLTESPTKHSASRVTEIITISPTTSPSTSAKNKPTDLIVNGDATTQSVKSNSSNSNEKIKSSDERPPLSSDYEELLKVCREADSSADMQKLVKTKLIKYYYNVHPDFVRSKGFSKNLRTVIANIQKEPDLVYLHLKTIVDELKVRSKNIEAVSTVVVTQDEKGDSAGDGGGNSGNAGERVRDTGGGGEEGASGGGPADDISSTGNKHTDEQIKKLNKALYILTKRIEVLESAEVDWEDEDSSYLQVERFKKRACQIYEKICDLTGESKNAHRLVKKPIHFNGTTYTQFNKTLQAYVNRTKEFPDYFDVLRMLEHCNRQYDYALANFEMKRIAHDAFIKVGKLLQSRRKTDLYETVTHFTAHEKDPATIDPALQAKLSENQKKRTRISDVIEKFAREQDMIKEELKEARQAKVVKRLRSESGDDDEDDGVPSTSASAAKAAAIRKRKHKKENGDIVNANESGGDNDEVDDEEEEDDEDDDEEDDEEQVNGSDLEADVEKLANGDLSDVESDVEIVINSSTDEINKDPKLISKDAEQQQAAKGKNSTAVTGTETTTTCTITKNKVKLDVAQRTLCVATVTKPTVTSTQSKMSVNTNVTRQKTADPLASSTPKLYAQSNIRTSSPKTEVDGSKQAAAAIANGRMKSVTQSNSSSGSSSIKSTTHAPTIKIVSVSSLKNKVDIVASNEPGIAAKQVIRHNATLVETQPQSQSQPQKQTATAIKRQRTVAEIVISDEES